MLRVPSHGTFDPDLDTTPRRPTETYWSNAECQRLIANPAFAFLVWLAAFLAVRHGLNAHQLGWFLFGLVLSVVTLLLGQYHCLDCGASGWALRAARHACPSVVERRYHPDVGWLRVPRLRSQFQIWLVMVVITLLFYAVLASPRH